MNKPKTIFLRLSHRVLLKRLSDKQKAMLLDIIFDYGENEEEPDLKEDMQLQIVADAFLEDIKKDFEKFYEEAKILHDKKVAAGKKGGEASASKRKQNQANGSKCLQSEPNQAEPSKSTYNNNNNNNNKDNNKDNSNNCTAYPYQEIIDYLNQVCGTNYRATTRDTRDLIRARMKEGFTLEDFYIVIDKKSREWMHDPEFCKCLRPKTLFSNKFESYLNQIEKPIKQSDSVVIDDGVVVENDEWKEGFRRW